MTDLCYNCGSCHLPQPCSVGLVTCLICHHSGHSWNFCHRGAQVFQADYRYFALCHNCDAWHLPDVCKTEEVHCQTCNSYGHLPYYCPISPVQRPPVGPTAAPEEDVIGNKRKRSVKDEADAAPSVGAVTVFNARQILYSPAMIDEVYKMKMDVVKDVLDLINANKPQQVFAYFAQMYLGSQGHQQQPALSAPRPLPPIQNAVWDTPRLLAAHQTPEQLQGSVNSVVPQARFLQNSHGVAAEHKIFNPQQLPQQQSVQNHQYFQQDHARDEQPRYHHHHQHFHPHSTTNQMFKQEPAYSADGGANVASTVEGPPHGLPPDSLHLPLSNESVQSTTMSMDSPNGETPQSQVAHGSPKAGNKRGGGRKPRAPRKSTAAKAKELAAQTAQAEHVQQAQQVQETQQSQQEAQQLQSGSEVV